MNIREFSQDLQNIYEEMGKCFSDYQKASELPCLEGCGKCCTNPEIEASPYEMLPLALKILDEGKLEEWLDRLENPLQDHCLLYQAHSADGNKGSCGSYQHRPTVCRMFGVSGYYTKHRQITLSICKLIKQKYPEQSQQQQTQVTEEKTPMLVDWTYRLTQLDPQVIQNRMPINQALKKALEKVALYALYQAEP